MYVFQQTGTDVKFLRSPRGMTGFLVQAEICDRLLSDFDLALLLVVIKRARYGIQIFRIRKQRCVCVVAKLA